MSSILAAESGGRFRPGLPLTVAAVLGLALLLTLGTWQVQRMGWKHALIAQSEAGLAAPAIEVAAGTDPLAIPAYRKVRIEGRYLAGRSAFMGLSAREGEPGTALIGFIQDDAGRVWAIDRGWIAHDAMASPPPATEGRVAVEAVLRYLPQPGPFTPNDNLAKRQLFAPSAESLAAIAGSRVVPRLLAALPGTGTPASGAPVPASPRIDLPDNHLGYAITWYGLAATLAVFYILMGFQRGRSKR